LAQSAKNISDANTTVQEDVFISRKRKVCLKPWRLMVNLDEFAANIKLKTILPPGHQTSLVLQTRLRSNQTDCDTLFCSLTVGFARLANALRAIVANQNQKQLSC
jgi:hypothetical protein